MRRYSRHIIGCLSVRLRLLKLVDEFSVFHFHRAFGETSFCVHVPKDDDTLLRIPCVKTVDVRARLPAGDQFVADANGLTVLCPCKRGVNLFFFPSGESGSWASHSCAVRNAIGSSVATDVVDVCA